MLRIVQKILFVNFVISALAVFAFFGYAKLNGLSIDEEFMGIGRAARVPYVPAWTMVLFLEIVFVCGAFWAKTVKARLFVAAFCAFYLLFGLVTPLLHEQIHGTKFYSFDRAIWWYACLSTMLYALARPRDSIA